MGKDCWVWVFAGFGGTSLRADVLMCVSRRPVKEEGGVVYFAVIKQDKLFWIPFLRLFVQLMLGLAPVFQAN